MNLSFAGLRFSSLVVVSWCCRWVQSPNDAIQKIQNIPSNTQQTPRNNEQHQETPSLMGLSWKVFGKTRGCIMCSLNCFVFENWDNFFLFLSPGEYGFSPGQNQYPPNQANHPQHPPPPYQRSNSFPQYQQPFTQQQQPGAQQGMQKAAPGMTRAQYMQEMMMRRQQQQQQHMQQQQQQQQMQQHYKGQYPGQYGVRLSARFCY